MKERNRGSIVQVGSALAFRGIPLQAPYCGAKAAGKNFTESVITEIKHNGWEHPRLDGLTSRRSTRPSSRGAGPKLRRQTQPVPPIYQPEIAADAIHWAAHHRRRQVYVGLPTVLNVLGEWVAPQRPRLVPRADGLRLADHRTSRSTGPATTTSSSRWTRTEIAARTGRSTDRAHEHSFQTTLTKHRRVAGSLAVGIGAAATGAALLRRARLAPDARRAQHRSWGRRDSPCELGCDVGAARFGLAATERLDVRTRSSRTPGTSRLRFGPTRTDASARSLEMSNSVVPTPRVGIGIVRAYCAFSR
jgi:hypothetical protein